MRILLDVLLSQVVFMDLKILFLLLRKSKSFFGVIEEK